jgi:hypothetical protein
LHNAHGEFLPPTSALKSWISRSHAGMLSTIERQKVLVLAAIEVLHRDALLLDPSVVTEIEDALAVDVAELHHVIVADAFKVMPKISPALTSSNPAG